ncbi:MAG: VWA domain-containing protein [Xanthomonadales bacterium]|jgi:Ca-activated chloride channel family protein|nr:VWA domain-containing protein [Xanthomonadales bacterium]
MSFDLLPLHFIRPAWLLALPLAVILPWLWRHLRRPSGDWARICDPHLLRWLSVGEGAEQPRGIGPWVAGLVLAVASVSLAGPSWQRLPDVSFAAQDARVVVVDLSQSMLAEDLRPSRLTRARFRLTDLMQDTTEGQVGLVAFAGDAYVVSPLTSDTNTIANMLPALRPDVVPVAGSRADRGLALAAELLERTGLGGGEILLVTDSATPGVAALARDLADRAIITSVLAVGTTDGAPIPSGSGFVTDSQGNVVIARLDLDALRAVADAGGGRLSVLDSGPGSVSPWRASDGTEFARRDEGLGDRWRDAGPWLLLILLPLIAFGFRRGLLFSGVPVLPALLVPALLAPAPAQAGFWDDLWQRRDQQAQDALAAEDPAQAARLARDPRIAGEAWYRTGEYGRAAESWSDTEGAEAAGTHYNRGNALALAGDLDAAIAAYDEALARNPDMEDALYNKALVEQLKQQQEQQQQSEDQEGEGEQPEGDPQESDQEGQEGEQDPQEGDETEGEPQESEQGEGEGTPQEQQMAQAWDEEDAQAMEQWLRRIPDDPGGLLRRKFRSEHQRRGAPPDERETW